MDVPVPVVRPGDAGIGEVDVRAGDTVVATTSTLLDVSAVAAQQLEANMPWILARAAFRRGAKAVAAKVAQDAVDRSNQNDGGLGLLAGLVTNLVLTAGEKADTRNWTSLPARLQVARFTLAGGEHEIDVAGSRARVRVAAGKDTIVIVLQPALDRAGVVLTDVYSRVEPPSVPVAPAPAPEATTNAAPGPGAGRTSGG
jgi:hypothetical protein